MCAHPQVDSHFVVNYVWSMYGSSYEDHFRGTPILLLDVCLTLMMVLLLLVEENATMFSFFVVLKKFEMPREDMPTF